MQKFSIGYLPPLNIQVNDDNYNLTSSPSPLPPKIGIYVNE